MVGLKRGRHPYARAACPASIAVIGHPAPVASCAGGPDADPATEAPEEVKDLLDQINGKGRRRRNRAGRENRPERFLLPRGGHGEVRLLRPSGCRKGGPVRRRRQRDEM
uniref:Uncharacterized protein n=1 Tax=Cereibacter sphaeroides (strain ATCC 17025 / ATH 2.4.3) TaxID=349102 RepID=A4X002_CERS5